MKLLLAFALVGAATAAKKTPAVYFEAGETSTSCHVNSNGDTVVHFDSKHHPSWYCSHNNNALARIDFIDLICARHYTRIGIGMNRLTECRSRRLKIRF